MYRESAHENRSLFLCGFDRKITAYERSTGKVAWVFADERCYGNYVDFAVCDGRAYVPAGSSIVCLDYATGKPIGEIAVRHDVIRVMADDGQILAVGSSGISCTDLAGNVLWRAAHDLSTAAKMPTMGFPGNIIHGFRDNG